MVVGEEGVGDKEIGEVRLVATMIGKREEELVDECKLPDDV